VHYCNAFNISLGFAQGFVGGAVVKVSSAGQSLGHLYRSGRCRRFVHLRISALRKIYRPEWAEAHRTWALRISALRKIYRRSDSQGNSGNCIKIYENIFKSLLQFSENVI
jgi:hypothetical protein